MKVLAVVPLYPPHSRVGAWLATHQHLAYLASLGHQVDVFAFMATKRRWLIDNVNCYGHEANSDELAHRADVVIGHCGDGVRSHRIAHRARRTLIQIYHGAPAAASPDAAAIVFNSETSQRLSGWRGDSVVCRPWTDAAAHRVESTGDCVTIVNCSIEKGSRIFHQIAERLVDRRFLAVAGGYGEQEGKEIARRWPHVDALPIQSDMRDVWRRTRILVMPSLRESWGMVGVEAIASGIPVIATDLPGPREALGDAATFVARDDVDAWCAEIERLHDPAEWQAASRHALARSNELAADDPRPRFAEFVQQYGRQRAVVA